MICTVYAPWFGQLPFYVHTFLQCCVKATNIQWIVHSDQLPPIYAPNIKWFLTKNLSERIARVFPEVAVPVRKWGHKLCDLKPFWHKIFIEKEIVETEYRGWIDWDVVHNLKALDFDFESAKFSTSFMSSPLYLQKNKELLEFYPVNLPQLLVAKVSSAWDERTYLPNIRSTIVQNGMTPEVDLFKRGTYAVHMYRAKQNPQLYEAWVRYYCKGFLNA